MNPHASAVSMVRVAALAPLLLLAGPSIAQCTEGCTAIFTLEGENAGDQFGWVSNDVGDLNNDGITDFLLTAPTYDADAGTNAGRVYVYSGADGTELFHMTGGGAVWWLGHDATTAGDVNGDSIPDIIAGAPFSGRGRAILYSGADGSELHTFMGEANGDQFGYRVHGGHDFNGDGTSDVVIGARHHDTAGSNAGRAYVYSGADYSLICSFDGEDANDRFGSGVAFAGDLNGDGRAEIAVGAMDAGSGGGLGYVYAYSGQLNPCVFLFELDPDGPAVNFGHWFMNGGFDVNNDGTPDIYVNDFPSNRAHIFSGVDGSKIWTLTGDGSGGFGIGRIVEDINGDCHADMILAAWASSQGATNAGKAFVYSGRTGEVLETYTHDIAGAGFGFDANGQGDMNGDGIYDWLITAASDLGSRGRAYVIAGNTAAPLGGDIDNNGSVNTDDLLALLAAWGDCPGPPQPCAADTNCDGTVDVIDLLDLLANWTP